MGVVWTMELLDTDTLIARADNAMYESKRLGTHGVTLFAEADSGRPGHDAVGERGRRCIYEERTSS